MAIDRHCVAFLANGARCPGWKRTGYDQCLLHSLTPAERKFISALGGHAGRGRSKARLKTVADIDHVMNRLFRTMLDRIRGGCPVSEALGMLSQLDDAREILRSIVGVNK
jgi:hypothetical protein